MKLQAIKKQSAESLTVDSLRSAITSGRLAAGTRITEAELADQFQVSRGTVRIALYQLVQEGLVTQTPYTGWAVTKLTSTDVWELYLLRASLESLGARLAAEQIDQAGKDQLSVAYANLVQACQRGDRAEIAIADFELHRTIVDLGKNRRLSAHYHLIEQQCKIFLLASTYTLTTIDDVVDDHLPIVNAILAGDGLTAARLTEKHNLDGGRRLFGCMEELEHAPTSAEGSGTA